MRRSIVGGLMAAGVLFGGLAVTSSGPVAANGASQLCPDGTDGWSAKVDTDEPNPATVPYTAPTGKLVAEYCVKAGTTTQYETFDPGEKSVVIDHTGVDSVSHWSVRLVDDPEQPDPEQPESEQPESEQPESEQPESEQPESEQEEEPGLIINGPASGPEEGDVDSAGPLPPAQTPDPTPAPPVAAPAPASLPATGSSSWALAGSAFAALLAGLGLVRFSRRPDGSSTA